MTISRDEVADFKSQWPCSGLPEVRVWAQFDKRNGDLVDMRPNLEERGADGAAVLALVADGQKYAAQKLGLAAQ